MAERSLRGMSIGAKSLESDDNVDFAARVEVAYVCPKGHRTNQHMSAFMTLAEEDEQPDEITKPTRTHWDMLMERRSEDELAALLEKRLKMHHDGWIPDYE